MAKSKTFVCSDIDDLVDFYNRLRKTRSYMPQWDFLEVSEMNKIYRSFLQIRSIECGIASEATFAKKQRSLSPLKDPRVAPISTDLLPRGRHGTRRPIGWAKSPSRYAAILRIIERPETWAPKTTSASSPA